MSLLAEKLQELYKNYRFERQSDTVSAKEFEHLILMFPAILVLQADGHIDTTEMMFLSQLSRYMSDNGLNISETDIRHEVRYLSRSVNYWRKPFMEVLKLYVEEHKVATEVVDIMISAAASSTGNVRQNIIIKMQGQHVQQAQLAEGLTAFISEDEKHAILNIVDELEIIQVPGVVDRIKDIM